MTFYLLGALFTQRCGLLKIPCCISPLQFLWKTHASTQSHSISFSSFVFSILLFLIHHLSAFILCPPPFHHSPFFFTSVSWSLSLSLSFSIYHWLSSPSYLSRGMRLNWCTLHWPISVTWLWPRPWRWGLGGTHMGLLELARLSLSKPWAGCSDGKCWCSTVMR